jgi:SAM-dependent methyltransferase
MPFSAWVRLPLTILERLLAFDKKRPWIVPSAVRRLDQITRPNWRVLELGSGYSTAWLKSRVGELVSCETDASWCEELRQKVDADIRLMQIEQVPAFLESQTPQSYDLVFVDCSGDRLRLLPRASELVKPGGFLLLDNSERYPLARGLLPGWSVDVFVGALPRPFCASETSIFRRPALS